MNQENEEHPKIRFYEPVFQPTSEMAVKVTDPERLKRNEEIRQNMERIARLREETETNRR